MLKRRLAVKWTVERFRECRFWTFTFRQVTSPEEGAARWHHLLTIIRREWRDARGVRVFEMHPGGHGLHIHVATPAWMSVRRMRALAARAGFGRVHVVPWNKSVMTAGDYLAKYLSKERPECLKGKRLVGSFGLGEDKTRQCDIKTHSPEATIWKLLSRLSRWCRMSFGDKQQMANSVFWAWVDQGGSGAGSDSDGAALAAPSERELTLVICSTIAQASLELMPDEPDFSRLEQIEAKGKAELSREWMRRHIWTRGNVTLSDEIMADQDSYEHEHATANDILYS